MINDMWSLLITKSDFFINLFWEHLAISMIAIFVAIIIGGIIGVLISEYSKSSKVILSFVNFLYTFPSISMLGFLIPFFGIGNNTAIIALIIYALLPMVRNTNTGIENVDQNIIEAATGMGSTRLQLLYKVKLPLATPVIMAGIRNMVTMTIALAGIASFIGAGGLGVAIYRGITTNNTAMTLTGSLLIAIMAFVFDLLLGMLSKKMNYQHRRKKMKVKNIMLVIIPILLVVGIAVSGIFQSTTRNVIRIATKPMSEQYVIGEMLKIMIEQESDLKVDITHGVGGGTSNIQPAMEKGEFDIYPEYTGTGWNMVLKNKGLYDESMFEEMSQSYKKQFNMEWLGMYGFNNSYALVVRKEIAMKYNLKNISDLSAISNELTLGAEYDFYEREDGYDALSKVYQLEFNNTVDLDIGLKYQAINEDKIDVMPVSTTDGRLSISDVVVLNDDRSFYPSYQCGNIVRSEVIEEYPQLKAIFKKIEHQINDEIMAKMNYEVEAKGMEPKDVAYNFLKKQKLLKETK